MKKNEIIELNGEEYTLELNRESYLKIDQYVNINKTYSDLSKKAYEFKEEIADDENPFASEIKEEDIDNLAKTQNEMLEKAIIRAFWIWLYPNHKLSITQVKELITPYLEDNEKYNYILEKFETCMQKCIEVRLTYIEEQKNLKAQINKNK